MEVVYPRIVLGHGGSTDVIGYAYINNMINDIIS
jgi:hypothetical protein